MTKWKLEGSTLRSHPFHIYNQSYIFTVICFIKTTLSRSAGRPIGRPIWWSLCLQFARNNSQPSLWTESWLEEMFATVSSLGIMFTYPKLAVTEPEKKKKKKLLHIKDVKKVHWESWLVSKKHVLCFTEWSLNFYCSFQIWLLILVHALWSIGREMTNKMEGTSIQKETWKS